MIRPTSEVLYVDGRKVEKSLTEALVIEDKKVICPVKDSIPILLEEQGIGTTQFEGFQ